MYTVVAALYPSALATSITLPMEILRAASQMASTSSRGALPLRFLLAGPSRSLTTLDSGLSLKPDTTIGEMPAPDLLILPAIWRNPLPTISTIGPLIAALPAVAATDCRIASVGTASCLLAEAGLLDNRPATTHWNYFEQFKRRYPQVQLKPRHLITQSDNIYCVGSVNSIADLMVHIVEEWFGSRIARAVENQFSPEIRQSFSAASYQDEPQSSHHDETVVQGQQWLQERLGNPVAMENLAVHLGLSSRSLNRRFHAAIGMSPQAYLQRLRLATAKDLLRNSNLAIAEISWQVGLQDTSYFSQLFRRHHGVSPTDYREAVRGKLFVPG